jgi:D-inositol-3-phosphate glycosyltransferase
MKQLKFAVLSVHSCPLGTLGTKDTGGMSVYIREIASELGKQGHLVDIYTRLHDGVPSDVVSLGDGIRLIHLKAGESEIDKLQLYPYLPNFALEVSNHQRLDKYRYDIIYSHYWLSGIVGQFLRGYWDIPHLITFHTLGAVKNKISIGKSEPELRIQSERNLVQGCDGIIATTGKEVDNLVNHYEASIGKTSVIPCGVNLETFHLLDKVGARESLGLGKDPVVLFVGRIEPLKGIDRLIKAFSLLTSWPKIKLIIIGGGEYSRSEVSKLQKLARKLEVSDKVIFKGNVPQTKLATYYSAADVLAIPSYYESFGLVALESLACGTPVVASDVGDLGNIIVDGKTGFVINDASPEVFADKLEAILLKRDIDAGASYRIRDSITSYHWSVITQAVASQSQRILTDRYATVA